MTTTVQVLIEGNKACEVKVMGADGSDSKQWPTHILMPGTFVTRTISGPQILSVIEIGDFLN